MVNRNPPKRHKNCEAMIQAVTGYTPAIFDIFQEQYELGRLFRIQILSNNQSSTSKCSVSEEELIVFMIHMQSVRNISFRSICYLCASSVLVVFMTTGGCFAGTYYV